MMNDIERAESSSGSRRRGGAGQHLTATERRAIQVAFLSDASLGTVTACALHFRRSREAIVGCLKGAEFEQLRRQIDEDAGESAARILKGAVVQAARAWTDVAIPAAAARGDHKPSRDLLVTTKVIA